MFTLSPQQNAVVNWVLNPPAKRNPIYGACLELIARAGCGKTSTLMFVIDEIVKHNLGCIAIMAYNKPIADEIKFKLGKKNIDWRIASAGTVHSFGWSTWRKAAPGVKLNDHKVYDIIEEMISAGGPLPNVYSSCTSLIEKAVGHAKNRAFGILTKEINDAPAWWDLWDHFDLENDLTDGFRAEEVMQAACKVLRKSIELNRTVVDYNDMIYAPLFHKARFWKFDWVLVDESQDTNPARRAMALEMLKSRTGRMIFVGDDRQAIYGFTGADSDAMTLLREATHATTLPLNLTYRCPKAVVALAQSIVPDIHAHETAPVGVVRSIEWTELHTDKLTADDAIICRNTAPLVSTAFMLLGKGVPCQIAGRDIAKTLINLSQRWKVKSLDVYEKKLEQYKEAQLKKYATKRNADQLTALLEDQLACLYIIIENCRKQGRDKPADLVTTIEEMFGLNSSEHKKVLELCTAHKSKGREWPRVYILGRAQFMPSRWAKKEWQLVQEQNLEYVAITRAMSELIDIINFPEIKKTR